MMIRVAGCLLLLAAFGAPLGLPAQSAKPGAASGPKEVLRTFRFVATSSNGQPVADLRPEEVQVSDQGKQPLVFAHLLGGAPASTPEPARTLGPREFSNRLHDSYSSSVLIFLDLLNANINERGAAWNETSQALEQQESADNTFLFLLAPDASLFPVHTWPMPGMPDPSAELPKPWTKQARSILNQALRKAEGVRPTDLTAAPGLEVEPTFQSLSALGRQFAALPGQKRVIWVTHGVPLSVNTSTGPYDFSPSLKELGAELSDLGVSIYTVHQLDRDTTGVRTNEVLQILPGLTGGRWFENDSIGPALKAAQTDARATYEAGYMSPAKEADGKFHKIRVSTTRKGAKILAADGYTAIDPQEVAKNTLTMAGSRPFDTSDIGLRASSEPGQGFTRFLIHADTRDLLLQGKGPYTGALSVVFIYYNGRGIEMSSTRPANVALNLTQEQFDAAQKDGYLLNVENTMPPGTAKVRLLIQDAATGLAGSLTVPVPSP